MNRKRFCQAQGHYKGGVLYCSATTTKMGEQFPKIQGNKVLTYFRVLITEKELG